MNIEYKKCFYILIIALLLTDLAIILNIPFLRQIIGFLFLTLLPGLLILQILKLKTDFLDKFILAWGLSISSLIFLGLLVNNLSLSAGYNSPLSTVPLLISFNLAAIALILVAYRMNKKVIFPLPNLNLSISEKAFLIVPILFPALSIFGMHVMNTTNNNIILMFLLFLIPIYVAFVCFFSHKFPKRLYPVVIFLISISLLLLMSLRSNHIIGADAHTEYYFFRTTLGNLRWSIMWYSTLDACLSISLLPTIYQSILNIPTEFLFRILYTLIYSISPLVIYVISKKYVEESYAFLASCFFMSQDTFLWTEYNARTSVALLFFALAMMTLFSDKIDPLGKRILFIVFMASCMVSHYSTTYIFFFIMLGAFVGIEILLKKYTLKNVISLTLMILFFSMIFFWYSQVTEASFNSGVRFIENTLISLNNMFVMELREAPIKALLGEEIIQKGIPHIIHFLSAWLSIAFIGIGVVTLIWRHKEMSFPELKFKKLDFLRDKFEVTFFVIALLCSGLLVVTVALPYIAAGYGLDRLFAVATIILSVFFVIGGIILSKSLSFIKQTFKKSLIKNFSFKKEPLLKKQKEGGKGEIWKGKENSSQVWAYLVILLVLVPYFLCFTGAMYNLFGVPRYITLNSEGEQYELLYVHDQDSYGAKWIKSNADEKSKIYSDATSVGMLKSQGLILPSYPWGIEKGKAIKGGYIYLGYSGVVEGKWLEMGGRWHNITKYEGKFGDNNKIYNNGGSEVWR